MAFAPFSPSWTLVSRAYGGRRRSPNRAEDVVHSKNGGRLRGTVVVADDEMVKVPLFEGTVRTLHRAEVASTYHWR